MSKLGILLAAGAGYVLGARAGRGRYDQIQQQASRVWSDPRVQKAKGQASDVAHEKADQASEFVQEKASQAAEAAPAKVSEARDAVKDRARLATEFVQEQANQATDATRAKVTRASDFVNDTVEPAGDEGLQKPENKSSGSHPAPHPNPNDMPAHPATERLDD